MAIIGGDFVGDLITAESRETLRSAITDKAFELAKRLGLTSQEGSIIATQMIQVVERTRVNGMECGTSIDYGPAHDPYGTSCDLDANHTTPHEGPHPMVEGWRLRWRGGGSCAGDALPVRDMQTIKDDGTVQDGG